MMNKGDSVFEKITLTPFLMILGVKMIFQCFSVVSSAIFVCNSLFLHFLQIFIVFFSGARSTVGEGGIALSPGLNPLHAFWIAGLDNSN